MNLQEAYDLMDLLLDKADQPYFIDEEKNQFIDQAIMAFINNHYHNYDQEQVSRDALSFFFSDMIQASGNAGFYVLPVDYVHLLQVELGTDTTDMRSAKILGTKDYLDFRLSSDPFNKATLEDPICFVRFGTSDSHATNEIHVSPVTLTKANIFYISFKPHDIVFGETDASSNVGPLSEIYQREIIDLSIRKMTGNIEGANIQFQQIEAEQSKSI